MTGSRLRTAAVLLALLLGCSGLAGAQGPVFTLADALRHAGGTADVRAAESALADAERGLADSLEPFDASLSLSADTRFGGAAAGGPERDGQLNAGLSFSATMNVPGSGPQAEAVARAENSVVRAEGSLMAARQQAVSDTVRQYLELVRLGAQLDIAARKRELAELELAAHRARRAAGAASELDELQAGIAAATAANDEAALRLQRGTALSEFANFLGTALEADTVFPDPELTVAAGTLPAADPELLQRRADVAGAELQTAEAAMSVDAARRAARPVGDLSVNYSTGGEHLNTRLGVSVNTNTFQPAFSFSSSLAGSGASPATGGTVTVGVGVSVPLGPARRRAVEAAELAVLDSALAAEQVLMRARSELRSRSGSLQSSEAQLALTDDLVRQAELSFERAEERFKAGAIPEAELLRSGIALAEARLQQARAADTHLNAALELARTLAINPLEVMQ